MLYADDTAVYFADRRVQRVEEVLSDELNKIALWIHENGLKMNLDITQFMCLSRRCREREADSVKVSVN